MSYPIKACLALIGILSGLSSSPAIAARSTTPSSTYDSGTTITPAVDPNLEQLIHEQFILEGIPEGETLDLSNPEELNLESLDLAPYTSGEQVAFSIFDIFDFLKFPNFIPGREAFQGLFRGAIAHFFVRTIGGAIQTELPIVIERSAIYPTQDYLPAVPREDELGEIRFSSEIKPEEWYVASYGSKETDEARTQKLIEDLRFLAKFPAKAGGGILLSPGDYSLPVNLSCMLTNPDASLISNRYLLSPLRGTRADALIALNSIALSLNDALLTTEATEFIAGFEDTLDYGDLQSAFMAVQIGDRLGEMDDEIQLILNLLPDELRKPLEADFLTKARWSYERFKDSNPSVQFPEFNEVLENLGPIGPAIQSYNRLRQNIESGEGDYQAVMTAWIEDQDAKGAGQKLGTGKTPWSQIDNRVFARMITPGETAATQETPPQICKGEEEEPAIGTLQVRIMPPTAVDPEMKVSVPLLAMFGDPKDENILPVIGVPRLPQEEVESDASPGLDEVNQ